jgi:hypothetical protein
MRLTSAYSGAGAHRATLADVLSEFDPIRRGRISRAGTAGRRHPGVFLGSLVHGHLPSRSGTPDTVIGSMAAAHALTRQVIRQAPALIQPRHSDARRPDGSTFRVRIR